MFHVTNSGLRGLSNECVLIVSSALESREGVKHSLLDIGEFGRYGFCPRQTAVEGIERMKAVFLGADIIVINVLYLLFGGLKGSRHAKIENINGS